jgi:hypothetical protein
MGDWDITQAPKLSWSEGNVWEVDVEIPDGETEYKYVLIEAKSGRVIEWQPGTNLVLESSACRSSCACLQVCDVWEGAGRVVSAVDEAALSDAEDAVDAAEVASAAKAPNGATVPKTNGATVRTETNGAAAPTKVNGAAAPNGTAVSSSDTAYELDVDEVEEVLFEAGINGVAEAGMTVEQAVAAMGQVVEADIAADAEDVAEASVVAKTETAAETDVVTKEADVIAEEVSVVAEADVAAEAADVKEAKAELPPMTEDTVIDGDEIRSRLQKLKVVELKEELRKHGMPVSGKKADLVERLVSAMVEEQE